MGSNGKIAYASVKTDPEDPADNFVDDSESLSDDERELILAQLYHSIATVPPSKPNPLPNEQPSNGPSPTKRKITFGQSLDSEATLESPANEQPSDDKQPPVPSTNFTFELDLDNLTFPPKLTPVEEVTSLAEDDDDFAVPPSSSPN